MREEERREWQGGFGGREECCKVHISHYKISSCKIWDLPGNALGLAWECPGIGLGMRLVLTLVNPLN